MIIEPIGYVVLLVGVLCLLYGAGFSIAVLCMSTLFGAAGAINLPALGGATIQPSHLLLIFFALGCAFRPAQIQALIASLRYPGPGFWFAGYVIFSILSAFFLPRIFAGATLVYSSSRGASGMMSTIAAPLAPGTSNLTQAVYLLGDLVCFALVCGLAMQGRAELVAKALVTTALLCLLLAIADVTTFSLGFPEALDFIRNAGYTMHTAETISGFKRIVGSFPEASAYGSVALAFFMFTLVLWLERVPSRLAGFVTLCLAASIALCTSSTAYLASLSMIVLTVSFSITRLFSDGTKSGHVVFVALMVLVVPAVIVGLMLLPDAWNALTDLASVTLFDKADSQSGEERTAWNTLAIMAFLQTSTFGAGLGTVRSSSFVAALLSNVGIVGTTLFSIFLYSLMKIVRRNRAGDPVCQRIATAAMFATIAQIVSATISGSSTDLALLFSITAGLAAGCAMAPASVPRAFLEGCFWVGPTSQLKGPVAAS
jgi:hypothetical protein